MDKWCADCFVCNSRKSPVKNKAHLQLSFAAEQPLQRIAMDIITCTPRGNQYIPVLGDYFTKWKEAFLLANIEKAQLPGWL